MVQQLMRASSFRTLLRACLNSPASTSIASTSRAFSISSSAGSSLLARSRTSSGFLAFPAFASQASASSSHLPSRRSVSLWTQGNSPAPIIGADGKIQKASEATTASASTTSPATTTSTTETTVTPTAASEELGIDFQSATNTVSTSATSSSSTPHHSLLESVPAELSESISETRRTLQEYGLGNSTPSGWVQSLLEWVHLTTGLPWWATIGATVIAVRLMLFPIMVGGISNNARLARIQPQLMSNIASIKKAQKDGNVLQVHKLQLATRQLFEDNKCGPLRGLMLPLIQMPLFISFFFALRGMAAAGLPDFTTGGIAWFTNLSVPDPTYVLPIVSAAATLAVLQVGEYGAPPKQGAMKGVMSAFKLATPVIAYVASGFPSAVLVYWVTHNSFSVLQALMLKIPAFKRWADIPDPPKTDAKTAGVGFMQAFRDTKEAFSDLKEGAVERTDRKFAEGQQEKAVDKAAEDRAARKKATLEALKASAVEDGEMSPADEKAARVAAARKRRESQRNRRSRI